MKIVRLSMVALLVVVAALAVTAAPVSAAITITPAGAKATLTLDATTPTTGRAGATFSGSLLGNSLSISSTGFSISGVTSDPQSASISTTGANVTIAGATCTVNGTSAAATVTVNGANAWTLTATKSLGNGSYAGTTTIGQVTVDCQAPLDSCSINVANGQTVSGLTWTNATNSLEVSGQVLQNTIDGCFIINVSNVAATFTAFFTSSATADLTISGS